ncbi:tetratricopeptide repeat protein [Granulicella sibirica]|nr:tetratricopeptide repeat protein [Granulicella sibirica]
MLLGVLLIQAPLLYADASKAFTALQHGRVDEAEQSLRTILAATPNDAYAHQLLCRVFYAQEQAEKAVAECEAAVAAAPNDSVDLMWLARAYGQKASHAGPIAGYSLGKKVGQTFKRAVEADPSNLDAVNDLGEFYTQAPGIVGGGVDKARPLVDTLQSRSPGKAHRLLAYIAESSGDSPTAEAEFKKAIDAGHTTDAYMDLGNFYEMHHKPDQAFAAVNAGLAADREHGPPLMDAATILIAAKRGQDIAERALSDYLSSPNQTDEAPVFKAHVILGKLLAKRGDNAGAQREFAAARALAANFSAARDASKGA